MANVKKENRVQDVDIKRLNHVGLGLKAIAEHLGCHPATVTLRLKAMGLEPTDTRRSFMEQVYESLTGDQQEWLSHNLFNQGIGVKEFVSTLIREAYDAAPRETAPLTTAPVLEMDGGAGAANPETAPAAITVEPEYVKDGADQPPPALPKKPRLSFR